MIDERTTIEITGVNAFFQSNKLAEDLAVEIIAELPKNMELISATNRGNMVWPKRSVYTECN